MPTEPAAITRFRAAHAARGGAGEIVILPESVHTAALAAAALGCPVGAIANSLLFDADNAPVLILTSGAHRVDTEATAERIGVPGAASRDARVRPPAHRPGDRRRLPRSPTPRPCRRGWTVATSVRRDLGRRGPSGCGLLHDVRRAADHDGRDRDRRGVETWSCGSTPPAASAAWPSRSSTRRASTTPCAATSTTRPTRRRSATWSPDSASSPGTSHAPRRPPRRVSTCRARPDTATPGTPPSPPTRGSSSGRSSPPPTARPWWGATPTRWRG